MFKYYSDFKEETRAVVPCAQHRLNTCLECSQVATLVLFNWLDGKDMRMQPSPSAGFLG